MLAARSPQSSPCRYSFTVFTAAYNRAHTLHRAYESLQSQTFRDFEWLVIDDGSQDGTAALVAGWQRENQFPIRYVAQPNLGKPSAFNRAVQLARGELFLTLDSDDACVSTALERFKHHWDSIPAAERGKYSAVTALCMDQDGTLLGNRYPADVLDSDPVELVYRFRVHGEKWGFQRTDVLKEFPFPSVSRARIVPENVVWDAIGQRYRTRYVNEVLRIYWIQHGPDSTQVSYSPPATHAPGLAFWHRTILNTHMKWLRYAPDKLFRSAVHYTRFSAHSGDGPRQQLRQLTNRRARALWTLAAPIGYAVFARDIARFGRS